MPESSCLQDFSKQLGYHVFQQKRPALRSISGKENTLSSSTQLPSARRGSKYRRLSDRWPVLNKLIKTSKSPSGQRNRQSPSEDALSGTEYEDNRDAVRDNSPCFLRYRKCGSHSTLPKYPSPLSDSRPVKRFLPARHNYPHRGYSQSALYHQRELWRRRKCEWDDFEAMLFRAETSSREAYGGIIEDESGLSYLLPPYLTDGPWTRKQRAASGLPIESSGCKSKIVNPATFPRLGDLSMARDPFLIFVDTWFADFPLWTISKLIWICDIYHRSSPAAVTYTSKRSHVDLKGDLSVVHALQKSRMISEDTLANNATPTGVQSPTDSREPETTYNNSSGRILSSSSTLSSILLTSQSQPWETCWYSRWEMLYNRISLAANSAVLYDRSSPYVKGNKEAVRIILTTPGVLTDSGSDNVQEAHKTRQKSLERTHFKTHGSISVEEEDEDYGNILSPSESHYRFGAHVDPLSMFATAAAEYLDPLLIPERSADSDRMMSQITKDYAFEMTGGLKQLTVCC